MIDIGFGCKINEKLIPKDQPTGLRDITGKEIRTGQTIKLNGCTSRTAIVGRVSSNKVSIFFGSDNGSVSWDLNETMIKNHSMRVI